MGLIFTAGLDVRVPGNIIYFMPVISSVDWSSQWIYFIQLKRNLRGTFFYPRVTQLCEYPTLRSDGAKIFEMWILYAKIAKQA